ncbi:hypothetical protein [Maritimibacter fusiformis]|uniref:Uncharacterized protein n=1 Tax=Maritimibacter fusiformis TaxID=2603819 RepID=A0A5D0RMX4_9RHOB|nr:hypothetical protein [Maritimibacter fusiformis]TYB81978.1 hypothetical protein FVF75_04370 [Maritimibacter fusiformis]
MFIVLTVALPGVLAAWLVFRKRNSWPLTLLAIFVGIIASYLVVYIMGNYVQATSIKELEHVVGEAAAQEITNAIYGRALIIAVGLIAITAIATKLRGKK